MLSLSSFKNIANKLGVDKSIFYTSTARIIQALGGILSIFFVVRYLTTEEQGFYYTFGSLVAIQVFFELGLNGIITQYVAHEASHLKFDGVRLVGEAKYLSRLSSLLHFSIKWYLFFAIILLVTLVIVGFVFFNRYGSDQNIVWKSPWILLAMGTSLNLLLTPILAYLEGLGLVKNVAKIRLVQQTVGLLVVWGGLSLGLKLYVSGLYSLVAASLVFLILFLNRFKKILLSIWKVQIKEHVDYKKEVFPYQWKIALSWISGYFIFQLFNPVLFATEGAVIAGQMGMTLAVLNGIQSLSLSWMNTKVPLYSGFIAQKQYTKLDTIFNRTLKKMVFINICCLTIAFVSIYIIQTYNVVIGEMYVGDRFLNHIPLILMMVSVLINQFVNSWAIYLRCHKQEPYLINSIVSGILCCLSTILLGKYFGVIGITSGYCTITFMMSFWGYYIYKTKKYEWHSM